MGTLSIGQVAKRAGVGIETIRFYEREGLLEEPPHRASGYRQYSEQVVKRIHFIKRAQQLGFSLKEIIDLLHVYPTMAEALKIVAISFTKDVNRLSCCAS